MSHSEKRSIARRGPAPLPVHIGLAMAEYARVQCAGETPQHLMEEMLDGIRKYQNHPFVRHVQEAPCVWRSGSVRLFHYGASDPFCSLLLVPSLVNRSYILDLLPQRSFARWLAANGVCVYLLDWGEPTDDPGLKDMDALMSERLCPAIAAAADHADDPVFALGYCMGGTLLAAAGSFSAEVLRGLVFLGSPWDFSAGDGRLAREVFAGSVSALQMAAQKSYLPQDWIQSVFAAVNADRAAHKFAAFAALEQDSDRARLFVAVEDWLNDGVDLPEDLAKVCISDWFGRNLTGRGEWRVAGRLVDPAALRVPALVVAARDDRLVPAESSLALAEKIVGADLLRPECGHIGMMTGRRAREAVWEPVAGWLKEKR